MEGIYCLMGKSACGKDSLYGMLLADSGLKLKPLLTYTTRPQRSGERDGAEYHFTDIPTMQRMQDEGRVIESRVYHTVQGDWYYFTADDGSIDSKADAYIAIVTPQAFLPIKEYYGSDAVHGLYIEVEDGERLARKLARERAQAVPDYKELCRRFLADEEDFSEDKLARAGLEARFVNDDLARCFKEIKEWILSR